MNTVSTVLTRLLALVAVLALTGCSLWPFGGSNDSELDAIVAEVRQINERLPPMEPMVLRASGFGAINPHSRNLSEVQQRLIAMRASKLDAYRTLAERVYGTQIIGSSSVEDMVIQNDRYKAFVDAHILGARVIYQERLADGSYETMVEMVLDEGFRNCLATINNGRQNTRCASEMVHDLDSITRNRMRQQGLDASGSGLYFID